MKIMAVLAVAAALTLVAACGGGGGSGPAPTPTTPAAKAASGASVQEAQSAAGAGAQNGLAQFLEGAGGMIVKAVAEDATKASETKTINVTENCEGGGSYTVTGTLTAECSILPASASCSISGSSMTIQFDACAAPMTVEGTTYNMTLSGPATASLTGTISVVISGEDVTIASANFTGTLGGTVTVAEDVTGTVDLSGATYTGEGSGDDVAVTCGGTTTVTLTGETATTCGVATTCDSCTQ